MAREKNVGGCEHCHKEFSYYLVHSGFNDSAYSYCDTCGRAVHLKHGPHVPAGVQLKVHQRVHDSAVGRLLKPCPCGGRFNDAALPRCPYCRHILSPILATHYIEANAPGAKKGWRWQKSWDGIYSIVIENEAVQDWWKIQ
jgi:hypothetical protein